MIISNSSYTSSPIQQHRTAAKVTSEPQGSRANSVATNVNISQAAKTTQIALANLPPLTLDPKIHMQNAETRLKEVMAEMSISASTNIDINVSSAGHINVKGHHEQLARLEEMLNSLIGAHTGSVIQRIGAAATMATDEAKAQPSMAKHYFNWVLDIANQAKASSFTTSFADGKLSGNLLGADGEKMLAAQDFKLPA